jgi:hypothetical protein
MRTSQGLIDCRGEGRAFAALEQLYLAVSGDDLVPEGLGLAHFAVLLDQDRSAFAIK